MQDSPTMHLTRMILRMKVDQHSSLDQRIVSLMKIKWSDITTRDGRLRKTMGSMLLRHRVARHSSGRVAQSRCLLQRKSSVIQLACPRLPPHRCQQQTRASERYEGRPYALRKRAGLHLESDLRLRQPSRSRVRLSLSARPVQVDRGLLNLHKLLLSSNCQFLALLLTMSMPLRHLPSCLQRPHYVVSLLVRASGKAPCPEHLAERLTQRSQIASKACLEPPWPTQAAFKGKAWILPRESRLHLNRLL